MNEMTLGLIKRVQHMQYKKKRGENMRFLQKKEENIKSKTILSSKNEMLQV